MNQAQRLQDLLDASPYLDANHNPRILPSGNQPLVFDVWVAVKEEGHLQEFLAVMRQRDYEVNLKMED